VAFSKSKFVMKKFLFGQCHRIFRTAAAIGAVVLVSLGSAPAQSTNSPPPAPRRTSIILIVADDLGYGDLGCYGQTKIKTPNLDKLASEGIRFTSFYAGAAVGAPSRAALLLGQHPGHLSVRGEGDVPLQAGDVTIAQVLKNAGYTTGLIGEWGLGNDSTPGSPDKKGSDQFVGYLTQTDAEDYYADHLRRYDSLAGFNGQLPLIQNADGQKGLYIPDLLTTAAMNFVRINKPDQFNRYRPFFLMLCYNIPHANSEEGRRTGNGMQAPGDAPYSGESWPQAEKNKAAMITRLDTLIGQLMDKLKELHMDENTVVVFTSGNGPHKEGGVDPKFFQSAGQFRGLKRDLYEGGLRVPMLVRWPGTITDGTVSDQAWAFWDVMPTLTEIALTQPPKNIDGISMLPTLLGGTQTNRHEFLYWESNEKGFHQAVRMGDWKAVRAGVDGPLELYNLKTDLGEKQNVADKNPEVVAKIEKYLKTARTDSPRWPAKTVKDNAKE
jgi:arylsulfatase A-like enzyme